ncbi:hypothetical protein [Salinarimonas ramus]|uniref:Lipoprotein n=1 Tax=Salinarimonas ramus TaxID=690164 RepID=A0A917V4R7_9HYPH|nr:hypothetical protein [Salinarimonas ramus]GGK37212.1 hypothetical protein GCM10011322_25300 [Salinarimonas ramus]
MRVTLRRLAAPVICILLAGSLAACSPYGPGATTGATTGAAIGGVTVERGAGAGGERVACEFDELYGRDVCYRY